MRDDAPPGIGGCTAYQYPVPADVVDVTFSDVAKLHLQRKPTVEQCATVCNSLQQSATVCNSV